MGQEAGVSGRHPKPGRLQHPQSSLGPQDRAPPRETTPTTGVHTSGCITPGAPGISESTVWDGARESVSEFSGLHGHRWSQATLRTTDLNYFFTAWFVLKTVPRCTTLVSLKHPSLSLSLGPLISQPPSEKTTAVTLSASTRIAPRTGSSVPHLCPIFYSS